MVDRIREILQRNTRNTSQFLLCSLPPPSAATAVASSASCQQLLPNVAQLSTPYVPKYTNIHACTNTNTFLQQNTCLKITRYTNELPPTHNVSGNDAKPRSPTLNICVVYVVKYTNLHLYKIQKAMTLKKAFRVSQKISQLRRHITII